MDFSQLAKIARIEAQKPYHGGENSNIAPLIAHFPKWNVKDADGLWCAAFVYHCCRLAGYEIPYSPDECVSCSLAGCGGWDEYARGDERVEYHPNTDEPMTGDIVLFDRLLGDREHDHIGIVLDVSPDRITTAEGSIDNRSGIFERPRDAHIRAYLRFPQGYRYER